MKIIGQTGKAHDNMFICEVPEEEVYRLIGHYGSYAAGKKLQVGDTIKVSAMYERLVTMKRKEAELEKAAALLRGAADLVEKALPAVHRANNKEKQEAKEEDKP